tara:strand:+ start:9385 stop:9549 length:165 start_codon:yes stop_codon:yes gene_type:complete
MAKIKIKQIVKLQSKLDKKVNIIEEHELISVASLIHRARMSIRQDVTNMKLILK